jgi:hypothetical protein
VKIILRKKDAGKLSDKSRCHATINIQHIAGGFA